MNSGIPRQLGMEGRNQNIFAAGENDAVLIIGPAIQGIDTGIILPMAGDN